MLLLVALLACRPSAEPAWCVDRADDADCDGVPDATDQCPATDPEVLTDRLGCSERQTAGCIVTPVSPADGERPGEPARFRWSGDCHRYLLQFSDDPAFPAAGTRTAVRTEAQEVVATGEERYWRVVGGMDGRSTGFATDPREIRW